MPRINVDNTNQKKNLRSVSSALIRGYLLATLALSYRGKRSRNSLERMKAFTISACSKLPPN
jgi:hypothetical protein